MGVSVYREKRGRVGEARSCSNIEWLINRVQTNGVREEGGKSGNCPLEVPPPHSRDVLPYPHPYGYIQ